MAATGATTGQQVRKPTARRKAVAAPAPAHESPWPPAASREEQREAKRQAVLTTAAQREREVWVALRHEIDYLAEAVPGDRLLARTWTGVARGLRYPRHTEIIRIDGSKVLARAVTAWCPRDPASARQSTPVWLRKR